MSDKPPKTPGKDKEIYEYYREKIVTDEDRDIKNSIHLRKLPSFFDGIIDSLKSDPNFKLGSGRPSMKELTIRLSSRGLTKFYDYFPGAKDILITQERINIKNSNAKSKRHFLKQKFTFPEHETEDLHFFTGTDVKGFLDENGKKLGSELQPLVIGIFYLGVSDYDFGEDHLNGEIAEILTDIDEFFEYRLDILNMFISRYKVDDVDKKKKRK
jgi:hypothetical protein